jgi:hypothetical protein
MFSDKLSNLATEKNFQLNHITSKHGEEDLKSAAKSIHFNPDEIKASLQRSCSIKSVWVILI